MLPQQDQNVKTSKTILIADDQVLHIRMLEDLCQSMGYETLSARNGREALLIARKNKPDCILMDVIMADMDGIEATSLLKKDLETAHIPIIMITALDSRNDRLAGIRSGADDILPKPIDEEELSLRLRNNLRNKEFHDFLQQHKQLLEDQVAERTRQLRKGYLDTIHRLVLASEYKDEETGSHIKRISYYTREIAEALGLDNDFAEGIFHASPMHDIGKVAIPDAILLKPGPLDENEWQIMKTHTTIGSEILAGSDSPYLQMAVDIARHHHERWDGSGYPHGLSGQDIPLTARIMGLCDQYDALRSVRPYKPEFDEEKTAEIIFKGDGRTKPDHFDPEVLSAFQKSRIRFAEIYDELKNDD